MDKHDENKVCACLLIFFLNFIEIAEVRTCQKVLASHV